MLERGPGVADHAVVGRKDAADLGGLDVHMHKGAALGVDLGRAGVAVGPAVTDADDKVTGQQGGVAVAVACLQADHAGHQRVVIGNRSPAHQRWNDRHAGDFCKLLQQAGGIGIDDAATGHDQRFVCSQQHVQRFFHLLARGRRLVDGQRLVGVDVKFDFGHLHVKWQVNQYRAWTARAHQVKGLLKGPRHLCRLAHRDAPLGDGLADGLDVYRLKIFFVKARAWGLPGDAQNWDGVRDGRIQTSDHVGAGRPRCADANADVARLGPCVAFGHVRCAFNVASQYVADAAVLAQGRVERVDGCAGHAKSLADALFFHHQHGSQGCIHLGHVESFFALSV